MERRQRQRLREQRIQLAAALMLLLVVLAIAAIAANALGRRSATSELSSTAETGRSAGTLATDAIASTDPDAAATAPTGQGSGTGGGAETAEPRIPLTGTRAPGVNPRPSPPAGGVDPSCAQGCIVRLAPGRVARPLWQGEGVAYAYASPEQFPALASGGDLAVAWPGADTLPLYVMFRAKPEHERQIAAVGTVLDSVGSVRLVRADRLPLPVSPLYAAGLWVEKLPPVPVAAVTPAQARTIEQSIRELSAIGARDGSTLGDRQFDGSGTLKAAEYLYRRFAELGYAVHYADFVDPQGGHQVNVVADPPAGRAPGAILVTAHYDSISPAGQPAPGADDNASGVAGMLEIARRVAAQGFAPPVSFVGFGAEEPGLYGSNAHAAQLAREGAKLHGVINLDSIGVPNSGRVFINGNSASRWIYRELVDLSRDDQWLEWMANPNFYSDDEHFRRQGFQAVMVTTHPWGTEPRHHTPRDTVEIVDDALVADLTDLVWNWVLHQKTP